MRAVSCRRPSECPRARLALLEVRLAFGLAPAAMVKQHVAELVLVLALVWVRAFDTPVVPIPTIAASIAVAVVVVRCCAVVPALPQGDGAGNEARKRQSSHGSNQLK